MGDRFMELEPIGVIHSPYQERKDAPRQGRMSDNEIIIEIYQDYIQALKGIERASHINVFYWADRADRTVLQSRTPFSNEPVGVFTSRSPNRPNPILYCVADLIRREGNKLVVRGVEALDGSPLLDIKAYAPTLECISDAKGPHINSGNNPLENGKKLND
jgi:tRNA-Thr(GGU) m(6)t(6)A37 methyltransferase TsaA